MILKTIIFNPEFSPDWQEKPFFPKPTRRNIKMAENYGLAQLSSAFGLENVPNLPHYAVINPSNVCNLHCPLCPTGKGGRNKPAFMKFSDFKKIMDQIGDYLTAVYITNWGEPFLNPDFIRMLQYSKRHAKIPFVSTSSNLNVNLDDIDLMNIVHSGLDMINVSVDGATQRTYEKYRYGGRLDKVIDNSKRIIAMRKVLHSEKPFVVWNFFIFRHNRHELKDIEEIGRASCRERV